MMTYAEAIQCARNARWISFSFPYLKGLLEVIMRGGKIACQSQRNAQVTVSLGYIRLVVRLLIQSQRFSQFLCAQGDIANLDVADTQITIHAGENAPIRPLQLLTVELRKRLAACIQRLRETSLCPQDGSLFDKRLGNSERVIRALISFSSNIGVDNRLRQVTPIPQDLGLEPGESRRLADDLLWQGIDPCQQIVQPAGVVGDAGDCGNGSRGIAMGASLQEMPDRVGHVAFVFQLPAGLNVQRYLTGSVPLHESGMQEFPKQAMITIPDLVATLDPRGEQIAVFQFLQNGCAVFSAQHNIAELRAHDIEDRGGHQELLLVPAQPLEYLVGQIVIDANFRPRRLNQIGEQSFPHALAGQQNGGDPSLRLTRQFLGLLDANLLPIVLLDQVSHFLSREAQFIDAETRHLLLGDKECHATRRQGGDRPRRDDYPTVVWLVPDECVQKQVNGGDVIYQVVVIQNQDKEIGYVLQDVVDNNGGNGFRREIAIGAGERSSGFPQCAREDLFDGFDEVFQEGAKIAVIFVQRVPGNGHLSIAGKVNQQARLAIAGRRGHQKELTINMLMKKIDQPGPVQQVFALFGNERLGLNQQHRRISSSPVYQDGVYLLIVLKNRHWERCQQWRQTLADASQRDEFGRPRGGLILSACSESIDRQSTLSFDLGQGGHPELLPVDRKPELLDQSPRRLHASGRDLTR